MAYKISCIITFQLVTECGKNNRKKETSKLKTNIYKNKRGDEVLQK